MMIGGSGQTNTNYGGHDSRHVLKLYTIHAQCSGGQEINARWVGRLIKIKKMRRGILEFTKIVSRHFRPSREPDWTGCGPAVG